MHQIFDYENASEVNPRLYQIISNYYAEPVVGGGLKTDLDLHHQGIPELTTVLDWIGSLVPLVSHKFTNTDKFDEENYRLISDQGGGKYNFNIKAFELVHCWGITYNSVVNYTSCLSTFYRENTRGYGIFCCLDRNIFRLIWP